jgi:hypothetical protein
MQKEKVTKPLLSNYDQRETGNGRHFPYTRVIPCVLSLFHYYLDTINYYDYKRGYNKGTIQYYGIFSVISLIIYHDK